VIFGARLTPKSKEVKSKDGMIKNRKGSVNHVYPVEINEPILRDFPVKIPVSGFVIATILTDNNTKRKNIVFKVSKVVNR
jgi:hypothetical protein